MSDTTPSVDLPLRPRDFAALLLASGDAAPRQRARDQQADRTGLDLRRRVLNGVVTLDPEAANLEEALLTLVEQLGPPSGPVRAVALGLLEEWRAATVTPGWTAYQLGEATRGPRTGGRHGRQLPG